MRSFFIFLFLVSALGLSAATAEIQGYWRVVNQRNGKPESIIVVYPHNNMYFVRMLALYNSHTGKITETIADPKSRAEGMENKPYLCGLDFIWNLKAVGNGRYRGWVIDPSDGDVYVCTVWFDTVRKRLAVRGQWLFFGKTEYWPAMPLENIPKEALVDISKLVPSIPKTN